MDEHTEAETETLCPYMLCLEAISCAITFIYSATDSPLRLYVFELKYSKPKLCSRWLQTGGSCYRAKRLLQTHLSPSPMDKSQFHDWAQRATPSVFAVQKISCS